MNIVALAGSLRRGSYNRALLSAAAELVPHGTKIQILDVDRIPLFNADIELGAGDPLAAVRLLCETVASADGLLIATPEYNQSVPGVLKNVIDWLSRPSPMQPLVGKPIALIGASSGPWGTRLAQSALRQVLTATESLVLPQPMLFIRECAELFDSSGRLTDVLTRESLAGLIATFVRWINKVQSKPR